MKFNLMLKLNIVVIFSKLKVTKKSKVFTDANSIKKLCDIIRPNYQHLERVAFRTHLVFGLIIKELSTLKIENGFMKF